MGNEPKRPYSIVERDGCLVICYRDKPVIGPQVFSREALDLLVSALNLAFQKGRASRDGLKDALESVMEILPDPHPEAPWEDSIRALIKSALDYDEEEMSGGNSDEQYVTCSCVLEAGCGGPAAMVVMRENGVVFTCIIQGGRHLAGERLRVTMQTRKDLYTVDEEEEK